MALKRSAAAIAAAEDALGDPTRNLLRALAFVLSVYVLSTIGFLAAGWNLSDSLYMVTLTIFSVGYGEVHPIDTPWLRALAMATIVLGCTGMIVLTGALVQAFAHYQIKRLLGVDRMEKDIARLSGHTIICGFGRIGVQLASELAKGRSPFVVIERDPEKTFEARQIGYLVVGGDATDEGALAEARIDTARVLATVLPNDAANVFITLSARKMNPALEIISRGELPSTESKLIHAGADRVVLPTHIGAEHIAELILYPATSRYPGGGAQHLLDLKRSLEDFGLEIEVVTAVPGGAMTGLTVGEAEARGKGAFFIVRAERPGGVTIPHPESTETIAAGDRLVLVLRGDKIAAGTMFAAPAEPAKEGISR